MPNLSNGLQDGFQKRRRQLRDWFVTPSGSSLLAVQQQLLDDVLEMTFGYYACQLTVTCGVDLLHHCAAGHHFSMELPNEIRPPLSTMECDPYYWPVSPGCLDVVVLHHMLEIAQSPHRLLSEAAKSIMPEGKLIIIGFNPWSLHALSRWVMPERYKVFSLLRFLHVSRLRDWLTLLGFSIERIDYGDYCQPLVRLVQSRAGGMLEGFLKERQCPAGSFYMIQATHEVHGTTPLKATWKHVKRSLVGSPAARPGACGFGEEF